MSCFPCWQGPSSKKPSDVEDRVVVNVLSPDVAEKIIGIGRDVLGSEGEIVSLSVAAPGQGTILFRRTKEITGPERGGSQLSAHISGPSPTPQRVPGVLTTLPAGRKIKETAGPAKAVAEHFETGDVDVRVGDSDALLSANK
ncbi:MAG: hypothetical protein OXF02_07370 [Simkaniaceae bacterium]|nr:hypothetical protein [Simkaniaceae bacterium]